MANPVLPQWSPYFFGVLGALSVLQFDGTLDRAWGAGAHSLAAVLFWSGVIWWQWYRRRLAGQ